MISHPPALRFIRCFVLLSLSGLPVAAQLTIDHVTLAGTSLDAMRREFTESTRIQTEYGGRHSNHATEMALVSFPDGFYLELMAIQPHADPAAVAAHVWSKFLKSDAGPCAFAIRANGSSEAAQLKSAGIQVTGPERGGRTRPDGTGLEWEITTIGNGPRGTFFPFLIRDLTPRENRAYPSGKPTTDLASGISKVVIGVQNLDEAIARYRRAFRLTEPRREHDPMFNAQLAWFKGTPIVLAQGLTGDSWLTQRVSKYGDLPCAIVLASTGGLIGGQASEWFGRKVVWMNERTLGWHLGMEVAP